MSKELYMQAHEELIENYIDSHPNASWQEAYEHTSDNAYNHMRERLADHADDLRQRQKDERL